MGQQENPYPLRLERDVMSKLRVVAKENGRSINQEIEICLKRYLEAYEKEHGAIAVPKE